MNHALALLSAGITVVAIPLTLFEPLWGAAWWLALYCVHPEAMTGPVIHAVFSALFAALLLGVWWRGQWRWPRERPSQSVVLLTTLLMALVVQAWLLVPADMRTRDLCWRFLLDVLMTLTWSLLLPMVARSWARLGILVWTVAWTLAPVAGLGGLYSLLTRTLPIDKGGFKAMHIDENFYAQMLVTMLPFVLALPALRRGAGRRVCMGLAACMVVGIVATFSRGGLLALGVATVVGVLTATSRRQALWLAVALAALLAVAAPGAYRQRIATAFVTASRMDVSNRLRIQAWRCSFRVAREHPWRGVGLNCAGPLVYACAPDVFDEDDSRRISHSYGVHDAWLQVATDCGMPAALVWLAIIALTFGRAWRLHRDDTRGEEVRALSRAVVASLAGHCFAGIFISSNWTGCLWTVVGLGVALEQLAAVPRRQPAETTRPAAMAPVAR
jgi:O-antigen ligase